MYDLIIRCCLALLSAALPGFAAAQNAAGPGMERFSLRLVDESVATDAAQGQADDDRFPSRTPDPTMRGMLWLKRAGAIDGDMLATTNVITGDDGKPIIQFHLTEDGKQRFAALTQANIGHRLAVVVNGTVLVAPTVKAAMTGGAGAIIGDFDDAEANRLAAAMMGKGTP